MKIEVDIRGRLSAHLSIATDFMCVKKYIEHPPLRKRRLPFAFSFIFDDHIIF